MFTRLNSKAVLSNKPPSTLVCNIDLLNGDSSSDILERDKTQSHRLHEPEHRINTIDPISGTDIEDAINHPSLEDGNLTMYFENEATKRAYLKMPIDHPYPHLPYPASDNDDRGG
jgi:YHS domain-containing protein